VEVAPELHHQRRVRILLGKVPPFAVGDANAFRGRISSVPAAVTPFRGCARGQATLRVYHIGESTGPNRRPAIATVEALQRVIITPLFRRQNGGRTLGGSMP
jgi:hypothetical protein